MMPALVLMAGCAYDPGPGRGVPLELAQQRAATLSDVEYALWIAIHEERDRDFSANMQISFVRTGDGPVVVDFRGQTLFVRNGAGEDVPVRRRAENLLIDLPPREGRDTLSIAFVPGNASLNRNDEYFYALFVPDRARFAFPVFDQPDLKARWSVSGSAPGDWEVVTNGPMIDSFVGSSERRNFQSAKTEPISTYLFTIAAGKFQKETAERDGRTMTMYHRESDPDKVARNRDEIFDLHAGALTWLEEYTGVPYPFQKFDFVLIPSFQFGGMEHPGAVFYRSSSLMLDQNPPQSRLLGRASLIAHETAHMWFGDLVTMQWFDDVWTKEVFANFMAAKIVEPAFPEVDHQLRFLLRHYPAAYSVDRTPGANAIRQPLANLNQAGSLYGAIIYQKAPIVMRNLERLLGEDGFQDGIREYMDRYAFANATWPDLIAILDERTSVDLVSWSRAWVEEPGRPTLSVAVRDGRVQVEAMGEGSWPQDHRFLVGASGSEAREAAPGDRVPTGASFVLPNAGGWGYGGFVLDDDALAGLLDVVGRIERPVDRGAAWITLWESVLDGALSPAAFIEAGVASLGSESVELIRQHVSGSIRSAYWRLLAEDDRARWAPRLEQLYWGLVEDTPSAGERTAWFAAWQDVVLTPQGVDQLFDIWTGKRIVEGLTLSEWDYAEMAAELALRDYPSSDSVLSQQLQRLQDPDRRARFEASLPALSSDKATRAAWFQTLANVRARASESRVLEGMRYLNHPLRATQSQQLIQPALELVREIQETGDIFFPKRWLDATLGGHQSESAAAIVREFIETLPEDYPAKLHGKILQSADGLFRAARIVG